MYRNPIPTPEGTEYSIRIEDNNAGLVSVILLDRKTGLPDSPQGYHYGDIDAIEYDDKEYPKYIVKNAETNVIGYGPLLYEVLIEYLTDKGYPLISDDVVSFEAAYIWYYYFHKRSDVKKEKAIIYKEDEAMRDIYWEKAVKLNTRIKKETPNPLIYEYTKELDYIPRLASLGLIEFTIDSN